MSCAHLTAESVVSSLHYFYHEKRKFSGGRLQNLTLDLKTIESSIFLNFRHFGGGHLKIKECIILKLILAEILLTEYPGSLMMKKGATVASSPTADHTLKATGRT